MLVDTVTSDEHAETCKPAVAVEATLAAWREQGAHTVAPLRFVFIEALARRSSAHQGETRRLLDEKLAKAVATYADDLKAAATPETPGEEGPSPLSCGPLAALLNHLAEQHPCPSDRNLNVDTARRSKPADRRKKHSRSCEKPGPNSAQRNASNKPSPAPPKKPGPSTRNSWCTAPCC